MGMKTPAFRLVSSSSLIIQEACLPHEGMNPSQPVGLHVFGMFKVYSVIVQGQPMEPQAAIAK